MKFLKKLVVLSLPFATLLSCVMVRQADLDAWQNVPVIELESQPVFNAMELEKKTLSDGSTLWSYTKRGGTFQNCSTNSQKSGTTVNQKNNSRPSYDRYGYDQYGYDRYGYDRYGYNNRGMTRQGGQRKTEVTQTDESTNTNTNCVTGEYVCVNQFLVNKDNMVVWYRPTGNNCFTTCAYRPASRPCPK